MPTAWTCRLCALFGASAVLLGAFAAHLLKDTLEGTRLAVFETAVRYQMYHALGLGLCWLQARAAARASFASWCFAAGIVLFSGSLYLLALTDAKWLGAVTPAGGLALTAGWLALGWPARQQPA